jgi:hypothetical protein
MLENIGASPSTTPTYHHLKIIDMKIVLSQHIPWRLEKFFFLQFPV